MRAGFYGRLPMILPTGYARTTPMEYLQSHWLCPRQRRGCTFPSVLRHIIEQSSCSRVSLVQSVRPVIASSHHSTSIALRSLSDSWTPKLPAVTSMSHCVTPQFTRWMKIPSFASAWSIALPCASCSHAHHKGKRRCNGDS